MIGNTVGKYRVIDRLGRGGMGTVYRAMDEMLHREVAIKVLNAELNDPEVAKRFRAEAITVARLSHPGIATIYELFEHEGQWLMVMEFVRGETLEGMVTRMGALSPQRAAELCMQALAALAHAHSMGVVHRDLKPANLMITENGSVKVMDFGIARVTGSEHLTNAGFMMGTPAYMAPEQVQGGEVDARADLYAMGVVFYRLATAALPFKGETPFAMAQSQLSTPPTPVATLRSDLPDWVEQIVTRALGKHPDQRFQSAIEFNEAFARCLAGLPLSTMYGTSASGDPTLTPGRPMPSGAFAMRPMPTPTGGFPTLGTSGQGQYQTTPGDPTMAAPGTHPMMALPSDPTTATPMGTARIANVGTPAGVATNSSTVAANAKPGAAKVEKPLPIAMIAGAAAVVIALGIGGYMMMGNRQTPPVETPTPTPLVSTEPSPTVTPIDATASPTPTVAASPSASPVASALPPGAKPTTTASPSPGATVARGGLTPSPTPTGTPGRGASPSPTVAAPPPVTSGSSPASSAANDPLVTFPDIRLISVNGKRTNDLEVVLSFSNGQVLVTPRSGGAPLATLPYTKILHATYVRARDPKWAPKYAGPPAGLDVGGVLRTPRHWLVIQGAENYAILRLEDATVNRFLETLEARTGLKVERVK